MYWSDEAARIFGYPPDATPTMERVLERSAPDDRPLVRAALERAPGAEGVVDLRHRLLLPDGRLKYVHMLAEPRYDKQGACEYLGAVTDVTAAVLAEQALHSAQVQLAHATRVTMLGELAASIAHEVNQPLAAISTNGEACLRWMNRPLASNMLATVARRSDPQHAVLDLNAVAEESVDLVRRELDTHRVALTLSLIHI